MSSKKNPFSVNDLVVFRYTGVQARIIENLLDGTFIVIDKTGEEIIAFEEDIVHANEFNGVETSHYQAKYNQPSTPSTEELFFGTSYNPVQSTHKTIKTVVDSPSTSYTNLIHNIELTPGNKGIFTCLVDLYKDDQYVLHIINDSDTSFRFNYQLFDSTSHVVKEHQFHIDRFTFSPIDEWSKSFFNTGYSFQIAIPTLKIKKSHKLKVQKLSKSVKGPLIGIQVPIYEIALPPFYSSHQKIYLPSKIRTKNKPQRVDRLQSFANFKNEIDLHAEHLIDKPSDWTAKEILDFQIKTLDKYLDQAIGMNIGQVFVIHGIGKGSLKNTIHRFLKRHKHVKKFINEYHENYGFGATRVHL